jgi:hypothetical protein
MVLARLMICKRRGKTCIVGNATHLCFRLCGLAQAIVLLPLTLVVSASTRSDAHLAIEAAPLRAAAVGASTGSAARLDVEAAGARFDTTRARFDLHGRALETAAMETVELGRHRSCGVPQATRSGAMAWTRRCGAPVVAAPSGGSDELDWRPFPWSTPSTPLSSFPLISTSATERWPPSSLSSGRRHHGRRRGCRGPRRRMCTPGRGENGDECEEKREGMGGNFTSS